MYYHLSIPRTISCSTYALGLTTRRRKACDVRDFFLLEAREVGSSARDEESSESSNVSYYTIEQYADISNVPNFTQFQ